MKHEPEREVYVRPECIFEYCPHPLECKRLDKCLSPSGEKQKAPEIYNALNNPTHSQG